MANPLTSPTTYYDLEKLKLASESLADANGLHGYDPILRDSKGNPLELGSASTNAIAHTLSSAYLAYDYSKAESSALGWAREYKSYWLDERPAAWDTFKDLYNNQVGRNISDYAKQHNLSRDQIQDLVLDALSTGKLIVTQQDTRIDRSSNGNPSKFSVPGGDAAPWTGPSAGFSDFAPTVNRVSVPTPNGSGKWTSQPTGMDITIIQLGVDTGDNNTAFTPIADSIEQTQFTVDSNNQLTQLGALNKDGTSTHSVFDVGAEPWSSETSAYNAYQRLQSQRVDFDNGSQQVKKYDPDNNHPYKQLDVTKGPGGQITAAQLQLEANIIAAGGSVGQIFGSALGRALAPNDPFKQIVAGTVAGLIGQKLFQTFTASLTLDASRFVAGNFASVTGLDVVHAGIGAISSFLTAELGHELHLTGFAGELFNTGASGVTASVLTQVVDKMVIEHLSFDAAIGAINWSTAATQAGYNITAAAGSFLAHAMVPAESHEGAVGGQLLGAVGSALGISAVVNAALTGIISFIIPGLGSFFGTIIGTMLGDAIAGDPAYPKATHDVRILGSDTHFTNRLVGTDDHGNAAVSKEMGDQVVTIANSYLDAVHGAGIAYSGKVMIGYNAGAAPYQYITGWFPNGTTGLVAHFATATDAIQQGVRELLRNTEVIGGDLLVKRAHQAFINGHHPDGSGRGKTRATVRGGGWRCAQRTSASVAYYKRFA